ncbi:MAG TPA: hypothetical protein PKM07_02955, partial [Spirochaetota bacterium]|nr:hypothetical protein [Spirochaetota bacterium]
DRTFVPEVSAQGRSGLSLVANHGCGPARDSNPTSSRRHSDGGKSIIFILELSSKMLAIKTIIER